jgi:hypothetical protein
MNIIHLLYMDSELNKIKKMYDKLTYFDQYGGSVVLFIVITLIIIILISYFHIMINVQPIIDDWPNQRCNPAYMPVAGFITHPKGISAIDYTSENFTYCTQNILSSLTGFATKPLTLITSSLQSIANIIKESIQSVRAMFDKVRTSMQSVTEEIMGRLMNVMIPLMQIIISFKDLVSKIQGTMTAGLFTLLGSYYTLQSLMGAIAQFIITILIALAAMISAFWLVPFTWGAAMANTVIFVAIAIPMSIILAFMVDVLKVNTSLKIPSVKCFDKNTLIKMHDGIDKKISQIELGDILSDNNRVTAKIKVECEGSTMYCLNNVLVSDSHIVKLNDKWIRVSDHPNATLVSNYNEKFLYCLNTSQKIIKINDTIFTDWDEIYGESLNELLNKTNLTKEQIHTHLDCGFAGHTKIQLKSTTSCTLKNINIKDVLEDGEKVYGIVEIDGKFLTNQYKYNIIEKIIEGHSLDFKSSKTKIMNTYSKLYHLLTDKGTFKIEGIIVKDYNDAIDRFLDKH